MQIPHSSLAEIMGQAGYDWVAVDMEHGAISIHQLPDLFRALELGGTLPLVRLAQGHDKDCKQALDAGAGGVIVPMVESAEQLIAVRDACRWPPAGTRGVGFSRANLFGANFEAYREEAQAPLLIAMIENILAVDCLEEILAVDGLDAILIGPYDLSGSLGVPGEKFHPLVKEAEVKVINACKKRGISCGTQLSDFNPESIKSALAMGYTFIIASSDLFVLDAWANSAERVMQGFRK
jgi:2-dehydro-3-deoxyglucarate aldolase